MFGINGGRSYGVPSFCKCLEFTEHLSRSWLRICGATLHADVTFKASKAALNKLGFGVNMLEGHFAPVSYTLIPAECESSEAYKQAWSATKRQQEES